MKPFARIAVGIAIVIAAWIPLNMAGHYDIPFGEAVLAIVGTVIGGIIVVVAPGAVDARGLLATVRFGHSFQPDLIGDEHPS